MRTPVTRFPVEPPNVSAHSPERRLRVRPSQNVESRIEGAVLALFDGHDDSSREGGSRAALIGKPAEADEVAQVVRVGGDGATSGSS